MPRFASFREFYPYYLGEHSHRTSRRLHFIGSCGVLALLVLAIVERNGWWLLAALVRFGGRTLGPDPPGLINSWR